MASKIQHVVADAGAFIRNAPLRDIGEIIYTIPEVVAEIRDKATRQRLRSLTYELSYKQPSADALQKVTSFAKQTGDYGFLSLVDLRVLALTYDLEKQFNGIIHLKTEPPKKPEFTVGSGGTTIQNAVSTKRYGDGEALPSHLIEDGPGSDGEEDMSEEEGEDDEDGDEDGNEDADEDAEELDATAGGDSVAEEMDDAVELEEEELEEEELEEEELEEEEDDDDDDDWITPSNITDVKRSMGVDTKEAISAITVGCLTTDFAMQNVLIQMGLNVLSVDGMLIKQVKSYVLRCYGCMRVTKDTSKQFCPHCGNKTLKRLSTSIDENGAVRYHLARSYKIHVRGKKYSLPKPMGGKHAHNPHLTADQPAPHQRPAKKAMQNFDILSRDYVADSSPFRHNDVTSRAAQLGRTTQDVPQWSRRNPNENRRKPNKRK